MLGLRLGIGSRRTGAGGEIYRRSRCFPGGVVCGLAVPARVGGWAEATSRGRKVKRKVYGIVSMASSPFPQ